MTIMSKEEDLSASGEVEEEKKRNNAGKWARMKQLVI